MLSLSLISLLSLPAALSLPLFGLGGSTADDSATGAPTPFSLADVNSTLLRPAQFARVAYCSSASITAWNCGTPCEALKNITFLQSGGDQGLVPLYFIAHDADDQSLVVAHEGTDAKNVLSILNDAQFGLVALNASRFPETAGKNITVHDGFQKTFERTADSLLAGVMSGLASTGVKKVVVTGHSLGAALATMTGAMIKDAVDPSVDVTVTGFGLPRGGNQGWADFLDGQVRLFSPLAHVGVTFVSNQNDPVPTVPPKFLGFQHSSGEIHIVDDSQQNFVACPGQDNANCATGNNVLKSSVANHLGPYFDDITFGGSQCSDSS
ncbi:Lipase-3 domain-containing protein [Mycena venus]|uniref:Lipase-3 domain-containing protein n=1 Tax=Mycena venus TaxID=2733690 RepID=A0A8H7CDS4_9AGAR|nr:Lipase-3 domain-containing protein [Mycena venus]